MSVDSNGVEETSPEPQVSEESNSGNAMPASDSPSTSSERETGAAVSTPEAPLRRIKIGSERDGSASDAQAKPVTPGTPSATAKPPAAKREPKHYPPPNIRDQLSPELEAEYMSALSDLSLENLLDSGKDGGVPPELAPETRVTGKVAKIHREDVFVDLPSRNQGLVPLRQFEEP